MCVCVKEGCLSITFRLFLCFYLQTNRKFSIKRQWENLFNTIFICWKLISLSVSFPFIHLKNINLHELYILFYALFAVFYSLPLKKKFCIFSNFLWCHKKQFPINWKCIICFNFQSLWKKYTHTQPCWLDKRAFVIPLRNPFYFFHQFFLAAGRLRGWGLWSVDKCKIPKNENTFYFSTHLNPWLFIKIINQISHELFIKYSVTFFFFVITRVKRLPSIIM